MGFCCTPVLLLREEMTCAGEEFFAVGFCVLFEDRESRARRQDPRVIERCRATWRVGEKVRGVASKAKRFPKRSSFVL